MLSASECLLKADNYVVAAQLAPVDQRMVWPEQAAEWRRRAFELQMELFGPFRSAGGEDGHTSATPTN